MRRKKDDKRVLRSGNGRQKKSRKIKLRNNNTRNFAPNRPPRNNRNNMNRRRDRKPKKTNKTLVFLMILALVAFVIGAGVGVSLSLGDDNSDDSGPHYHNVTKEMTSNLNETDVVTYDYDVDGVDYNENGSSIIETEPIG